MTDTPEETPEKADEKADEASRHGALFTLEVFFLLFVGAVTAAAFLEALGYALVSARTPFVIMIPLFVLILLQARRLHAARGGNDTRARAMRAALGKDRHFNKVLGISGWMVALVAVITVLGHYAGMFAFCAMMMGAIAKERWALALVIAAVTTFIIFAVFEYIFSIELYRGLVLRYFLGYRDF